MDGSWKRIGQVTGVLLVAGCARHSQPTFCAELLSEVGGAITACQAERLAVSPPTGRGEQ